VLVWKVGSTAESARAGLAHTRSAPVPAELWDAMLLVCGALKVGSIEEMLDTAAALRHVGDPGAGCALIAVSGGHSGKIADVFAQAGFLVPRLSDGSLRDIAAYAELAGGSYQNPIEGPSVRGNANLGRMLEILDRDPGVDTVVVEFGAGAVQRDARAVDDRIEVLRAFLAKRPRVRAVCVLSTDIPYAEGVDVQALARRFLEAGVPCFPSMERGALALRNARAYHTRSPFLQPHGA
jgi:acyl-CoA synthetase (NDP forming)